MVVIVDSESPARSAPFLRWTVERDSVPSGPLILGSGDGRGGCRAVSPVQQAGWALRRGDGVLRALPRECTGSSERIRRDRSVLVGSRTPRRSVTKGCFLSYYSKDCSTTELIPWRDGGIEPPARLFRRRRYQIRWRELNPHRRGEKGLGIRPGMTRRTAGTYRIPCTKPSSRYAKGIPPC